MRLIATLNGLPIDPEYHIDHGTTPGVTVHTALKPGDRLLIEAIKPPVFKVFYEAAANVRYAREGDICIGESMGSVTVVIPKFIHKAHAQAYAEKVVAALNAARDRGEI